MADIGIIKFQLAGINFGMYADRILEIVRFTGIRKIPRPLPYVVGISELRNYIVVVMDFRKRLGLSPLPLETRPTMIVAKISTGMIGLLVESISHFRKIPEEKILPPISLAGFPEQLLRGVVAEEDEEDIMLLPDLDKIFTSYIRIQLVSMAPSEKIAFQFRFTPGALTRTLENTLTKEGFLDQKIINTLPHSICLPAVLVHKVTSYYPDFLPKKYDIRRKSKRRPSSPQKIRAGDETYLSLSKKLYSEPGLETYEGRREPQHAREVPEETTGYAPQIPKSSIGEDIRHIAKTFVLTRFSGQSVSPKRLLSHPKEAIKNDVKTLDISLTRLSKYLNYHEPSEMLQRLNQQGVYATFPRQSLLNAVPFKERLEELVRKHYRVEEVLQILSEEQYVFTRLNIQRIAKSYGIPLVKIAKLCLNFPEFRYNPGIEQERKESTDRREQLPQGKKEADVLEISQTFHGLRTDSVSEYMHRLAENRKLFDDQVIRTVASRLRIPTCRLSKLRSFYQFEDS